MVGAAMREDPIQCINNANGRQLCPPTPPSHSPRFILPSGATTSLETVKKIFRLRVLLHFVLTLIYFVSAKISPLAVSASVPCSTNICLRVGAPVFVGIGLGMRFRQVFSCFCTTCSSTWNMVYYRVLDRDYSGSSTPLLMQDL